MDVKKNKETSKKFKETFHDKSGDKDERTDKLFSLLFEKVAELEKRQSTVEKLR
jgi:hypothetical protein